MFAVRIAPTVYSYPYLEWHGQFATMNFNLVAFPARRLGGGYAAFGVPPKKLSDRRLIEFALPLFERPIDPLFAGAIGNHI